jgi:hypothetical protein
MMMVNGTYLSCIWAFLALDRQPLLLKTPANWRFEQFSLPAEFAPTLKYNGIEELRFSPGMFDKGATGYFKPLWQELFKIQREFVMPVG